LASLSTNTTTTVTTTTSDRSGFQLQVDSQANTISVGDYVTDVSIQPYIAPRIISFLAYNMRPNHRMHIFFDSINVDDFCAPAVRTVSNTYNTAITNTSDYNSIPRNGNWGTAIYSDVNGVVAGQFAIPEATFRTGDRNLQISDVDSLSLGNTAFTTICSGRFTASNLSVSKRAITLTTVNPQLSYQPIEERVVTTNTSVTVQSIPDILNVTAFYEPIAQSLTINTYDGQAGIYATALDIYFKQKSQISTNGVTVYLCEVDNGYPNGNAILPFSTVHLNSSQISASNDATVPTTFRFESPVFLANGKQYAFIVKPDANDPDYYVYSANLGDIDITTGAQVFSQPTIGTAFYGATMNQWTALQTEYIKFELKRASFNQNSGNAYFNNIDTDFIEIYNLSYVNTSAGVLPGDYVFDCDQNNFNIVANTTGFNNSTDVIKITNANTYIKLYDRVYYSVPAANTPIAPLTGNSYYYVSFVNTSSVALSSTVGGANIDITDTRTTATAETHVIKSLKANTSIYGSLNYFDTVKSLLYVDDTTGNFKENSNIQIHRFANSTAISSVGPSHNTMVGFANSSTLHNVVLDALVPQFAYITPAGTTLSFNYKGMANTYADYSSDVEQPIIPGYEVEFLDKQRMVASRTNEITSGGSKKSMQIRANLTTDSEYISPLIDTVRNQELVIGNDVDPVSFSYEELLNNGTSKSKYISQIVTLATGQDAQDINISLTAFRPPGSDIKVWVKFLNGDDTDPMSSKTWTPLINQNDSFYSDPSNPSNFSEFVYTVPAAFGMIPVVGTITAANSSATVTGSGTSFTTDLSPGWFINVRANTSFNETTRQILSIQSDTQLTLDLPFNGNYTSNVFFLAVPPTTAWLSSNTTTAITGTVSTYTTNNAIIGSGTAFTTELNRGSILLVNNDEQVVVSIANDTFLSVGTPWTSNNSGVSAYSVTPAGLTYLNSNFNLYSTFKRFQIKIVLQSDDTSKVPVLDDLRVLALQL
jgi:hypothetical protein